MLVAGVGQHGARQSGATSHPIGTTKSPSGIVGDPRWLLVLVVGVSMDAPLVSHQSAANSQRIGDPGASQ